jgi:hypothetical protein
MTDSQPASQYLSRPTSAAAGSRVSCSCLLPVHCVQGLNARATLFVFRSIGWTDRLSFSVSSWKPQVWYGTVKRFWEAALFSLPVLGFLPRQGSRLRADCRPKAGFTGSSGGCLLPCACGPVCCCRTRYVCRWRVALVARSGTRGTRLSFWFS